MIGYARFAAHLNLSLRKKGSAPFGDQSCAFGVLKKRKEGQDFMEKSLRETNLTGLGQPKRGKVRDIYDLGGKLLIIASD